MTLLVCFRRVCPIHIHFHLAISLLMLCWSVLLQISLFVVLSWELVFRMYLRHLLVNVCSIRVVVLFALHVSQPYSSSLFTLVLKMPIVFRVEKDDMFHTVYKTLNECLAFPNLFLTSSPVPPLYLFPSAVPWLVVYCSPLVVLFSLQLYLSLLCTVHL